MTATTYTLTARWLHWLIVAAIVLQYVLANLAEAAAAESATLEQLALLANHKSVGMTILAVAIVRLGWRWRHPAPALPEQMPAWHRTAANVTHWGLYLCLLLLPMSGWLMSSASAYSVSWFNVLQLPDLVAPDEALTDQLKIVHETLAGCLFVLALLHIGAAIKHALWDRDDVLTRMTSWPALVAAGVVFVLGIVLLQPSAKPIGDEAAPAAEKPAVAPVVVDTSIPSWVVDYEESFVEFSGEQAGAPFTGRWTDWQADIRFDPEQLAASSAEVTIQTGAVSTDDAERDNTIRGIEFFDVANFTQATFTAVSYRETSQGYVAQGELLIKSVRLPLEFQFTVVESPSVTVLSGTATIDRLAFNVGTGDWQDTTWVGQHVAVRVLVTAGPRTRT